MLDGYVLQAVAKWISFHITNTKIEWPYWHYWLDELQQESIALDDHPAEENVTVVKLPDTASSYLFRSILYHLSRVLSPDNIMQLPATVQTHMFALPTQVDVDVYRPVSADQSLTWNLDVVADEVTAANVHEVVTALSEKLGQNVSPDELEGFLQSWQDKFSNSDWVSCHACLNCPVVHVVVCVG